jgi:hypothetical protein
MRTDLGSGTFTIAGVFTPDECRSYVDWLTFATMRVPSSIRQIARRRFQVDHEREKTLLAVRTTVATVHVRREPLTRAVSIEAQTLVEPHGAATLEHRRDVRRHARPHAAGRGGETRFENVSVAPAPGLALVFDHYLMHEGAPVIEGQKYVLRTDVMYSAESGHGRGDA